MAVIEAISTTYLEADAASVTFSSIPTTYEHLQLRVSAHTAKASSPYDTIFVRLNGYSSGLYTFRQMWVQGNNTSSASVSAGVTGAWPIQAAGESADRGYYGTAVVDIYDYRNSVKRPVLKGRTQGGLIGEASTYLADGSGMFYYQQAVTSITVISSSGNNMMRGSAVSLYGLNSA